MVLLVFVHGYNLQNRYMQPWTMPWEPLTPTSFTEYFLANGIFRFRIPMLFIISGYLYALSDYKPYKERTTKRLRTLLLPYLIWSAVGFGITWLFELVPYTNALIRESHIVQIDDNRMLLHDYKWYEALVRWLLVPVPYQLWFIRVLLIYNIAYPAIRWCVTNRIAKWFFFTIVIFLWINTAGFLLVEGEGLLFFSLGVWIQKTDFNIETPKRWLNPKVWACLLVVLAAVKTWIAFRLPPLLGNFTGLALTLLHKCTIISGLIAAWFGCNGIVRWCMSRSWFVWLSAFSFIIYALHAPLVAFAIDGVFAITNQLPFYRILDFVLLPVAVIILTIIIGFIIRSIAPKLYSLLTGGRGLQ